MDNTTFIGIILIVIIAAAVGVVLVNARNSTDRATSLPYQRRQNLLSGAGHGA